MQDSFLENDDEEYKEQGEKKRVRIPYPERKMYSNEIGQMEEFGKRLKGIHEAINNVLIELNQCEEGEKRRFPYFLLKQIEKVGKDLKILKEETLIKNESYIQHISQRQKDKQSRNALFKFYLKHYGTKRQELKAYMNKVETRVRKLEDSGYAQYIEYDVIVPEMYTIRFSYSSKTLLNLIKLRNELSIKVKDEIVRRKCLQNTYKKKEEQILLEKEEKNYNEDRKQSHLSQLTKKQNNYSSEEEQRKKQFEEKAQPNIVSMTSSEPKNILLGIDYKDLVQVLNIFQIYKYFCNNRILLPQILKLRQSKQSLQLQIGQLQKSVKSIKEHLYKTELKVGVLEKDPRFTKTDHFILLKQYQLEIKQKLESKIFQIRDQSQINIKRSYSWPKRKS